MWLAAGLDFADGFVARALKAYSEIGKQLDSLADMVTFGVLPAYIMYSLIDAQTDNVYLPFIAFIIAALSALRLAIFNVDTRQSNAFIGVPTPANALLISSFPLILNQDMELTYVPFLTNPVFLSILSLILAYLLVAKVKLLAFKFNNTAWKGNEARYLFMIITIILFIWLKVAAIPVLFILYLLISIINNYFSRKHTKT